MLRNLMMRFLLVSGLILLSATASHASDKELFAIAHMANTRAAVDWAVTRGANAVEIDLQFNDQGNATAFRHGGICDCICAPGSDSICSALASKSGRRYACEASEKPKPLLNHIAAKTQVALVVIDSKVGPLQATAEATAGQAVIRMIEQHLFSSGYTGSVIVSAAKLKAVEYLRTAAQAVKGKPFADKVFFSFDQERNDVVGVLTTLRDLPTRARAFGTGRTACLPGPFRKGIRSAAKNRRGGSASLVYIWTLDRELSMERFIRDGAQGIMTNYPERARRAIQSQGKILATRRTTIPLATSDTIEEGD